jgi:hypothetical protein
VELNQVLDRGLVDIHAHMKATADTFELTWLDLMNNGTSTSDNFDELNQIADPTMVTNTGEHFYDLCRLIQMAISLRLRIFRVLLGTSLMRKSELEAMKMSLHGFEDLTYLMNDYRLVMSGIAYEKTCAKECIYRNKTIKLDYAIREGVDASIYSIHAGERSLLFHFFYRYFRNDENALKIADYVYLYLLIKARVRREFIQTNTHFGLKNFQIYEHRKSSYINIFKELYPIYAVQSTLRNANDALEARITVGAFPQKEDFSPSLFQRGKQAISVTNDNLRLVVHLIKKDKVSSKNNVECGTRFGFRTCYKEDIDKILKNIEESMYPFVGLDVAGSELNCPPEVFGQVYRYARKRGISNFTYHVGEDFMDLADGLRRIDEAIEFLELRSGSRLGHALALGINSEQYYALRQRNVVMDKQRLLDTLTWLLHNAGIMGYDDAALISQMTVKVFKLYHDIGYPDPIQIDSYYLSQRLRSDGWGQGDGNSVWKMSLYCQGQDSVAARSSEQVRLLHEMYRTNHNIYKRGNEQEYYEYPDGIERLVGAIQKNMRATIAKRGITIECNPTSNVKIGPINGYDEHPIFQFKPIATDMDSIPVAICTDDKGIFGTSLSNEYSLIAYSLQKKLSKKDVLNYLEEVRTCAWTHRF